MSERTPLVERRPAQGSEHLADPLIPDGQAYLHPVAFALGRLPAGRCGLSRIQQARKGIRVVDLLDQHYLMGFASPRRDP